ncbi:FecCD family ABC transporter permease [Glycomyces harbinensis]|uniref:Iron complex transport system permease protein n=1 Tax=Glycomyces harbinensis TaxID=58114 RepID=A0A1G6QY06_9ACTN|nr:iron chelate uptake ABC transporter family permease subunit [Glycomyces harbinensis]SDC96844.1 iron complex transport system permease protein [Glycomyces harbinensis]
MTTQSPTAATAADDIAAPDRRRRRLLGLVAAAAALLVLVALSLVFGSRPLPIGDVLEALRTDNGDPHTIVVGQRLPRTALAVVVGIALAVAGALMQGLTRNPLADPGLLGVSAGAALGMVAVVRLAPAAGDLLQVWAAFAGAVITACAVFLIGSAGGRGRSPVTLVLAGVALGAVLQGIASTIVLLNADAFLTMRSWQAGSVADLGWSTLATIAPFIGAGLVLAAVAARGLNAVALGDDLATALGGNQWLTRIAVVGAVTLLCGSATAAVGVVWFLGMMVPHAARWITGPDQRWILAYSCLLGPALMVAADVLGRVVVIPDEIPAGIVTAVIGAPVLIMLVRRTKASGL